MTPAAVLPRLGEVMARLSPPFGPRELPPPVPDDDPLDDIPPDYAEFLRLADGASCGAAGELRLWSADWVRRSRFLADQLPGGQINWCPYADAVQNPIFARTGTSELWWFSGELLWYTDTELTTFHKGADSVVHFLEYYVLGPGYRELTGAGPEDAWVKAAGRDGARDVVER